jgi:hypothetical protein
LGSAPSLLWCGSLLLPCFFQRWWWWWQISFRFDGGGDRVLFPVVWGGGGGMGFGLVLIRWWKIWVMIVLWLDMSGCGGWDTSVMGVVVMSESMSELFLLGVSSFCFSMEPLWSANTFLQSFS